MQVMMSSGFSQGSVAANRAGMMAKYLARSLAMENVVSAPRVISSCLPISTTSISLVGSLSRSTMLPASLAAWVPEFMATPTSAWARAGASLVPSPIMATSLPAGLLLANVGELGFRRGLGDEVVHARLRGDRRGRQGVVAGDHHGPQAHPPQAREPLGDARLEDVFQHHHPGDPAALADQQRRGPFRRHVSDRCFPPLPAPIRSAS